MNLDGLKELKEKQESSKLQLQQHQQSINEDKLEQAKTRETIGKSVKYLIDYLDNHTTRTHITNQLKSVGTPDALKVVDSINKLRDSLENQPNHSGVLDNLLKSTKENKPDDKDIIKAVNDIDFTAITNSIESLPSLIAKESQEQIDYTIQLDDLKTGIDSLQKVVKKLKLETTVEAPVVNVEKPDLEPIDKELKKVTSAVKGIKLPKTDLTKLEKEQLKQTKLLKEIRDTPGGGGSGGGGKIYATNTDNELIVDATVNVSASVDEAVGIDDTTTANTLYVGKATIATATSSALWKVSKLDESTGLLTWADGDDNYDNVWDNRASLSYS